MKSRKVNIQTKYGSFDLSLASNSPEKGYTVTVPKLRGVVTHGDTIIEAKKMGREAVELHCEGLLADGLAEVRLLTRSRVLA